MPALVNSRVGSSLGSKDEEGTSRCPRATKKSRNSRRMSAERIRENIPTPRRRGLTAERAVYCIDRLASRKAAPGEVSQQSPALDRTRHAVQLGDALGGQRRRERPPVALVGPLLGNGLVHQRPCDSHPQEVARQTSRPPPPLGAGRDIVASERQVVEQSGAIGPDQRGLDRV